jgi:hypothetical protein
LFRGKNKKNCDKIADDGGLDLHQMLWQRLSGIQNIKTSAAHSYLLRVRPLLMSLPPQPWGICTRGSPFFLRLAFRLAIKLALASLNLMFPNSQANLGAFRASR